MSMSKAQRRRIIATRTALGMVAPVRVSTEPVSRNLALRTQPTKAPVGPIRKSRALSRSVTQRDSEGHVSAWAKPSQIGGATGSTITEKRWDLTVSDRIS